jgi:hypothetical protein
MIEHPTKSNLTPISKKVGCSIQISILKILDFLDYWNQYQKIESNPNNLIKIQQKFTFLDFKH